MDWVSTQYNERKSGSTYVASGDISPYSELTEPPAPEHSEALKSDDQELWLRSPSFPINGTYDEDARRLIWRGVEFLNADPVEEVRKIARNLKVSVHDNVKPYPATCNARRDSITNNTQCATSPSTENTTCPYNNSATTDAQSLNKSISSKADEE